MDILLPLALVASSAELVSAAPLHTVNSKRVFDTFNVLQGRNQALVKAFKGIKLPARLAKRIHAIRSFELRPTPAPTNPKLLMLKTVQGGVHRKIKRRIAKRAVKSAAGFTSYYSTQHKYFPAVLLATILAAIILICCLGWGIRKITQARDEDDDDKPLGSRRRLASSVAKLPTIPEVDDFYPSDKDALANFYYAEERRYIGRKNLSPTHDPVPAYTEFSEPLLAIESPEQPIQKPTPARKSVSRGTSGFKTVTAQSQQAQGASACVGLGLSTEAGFFPAEHEVSGRDDVHPRPV